MDDTEIKLVPGRPNRGKFPVSLMRGDEVLLTGKVNPHAPKEIEAFVKIACKKLPGIKTRKDDLRTQLLQLAAPKQPAGPLPRRSPEDHPYSESLGVIYWLRPMGDGDIPVPLLNFTAKIVADVLRDDGTERQTEFQLEAALGGRKHCFTIPAAGFHAMNWPAEHLGAQAIVYPGQSIRDHARAAIQFLSPRPIPRQTIYTHMGWTNINGRWVYLHNGGGIGQDGPLTNVSVDLGDSLSLYRLPAPPQGPKLKEAIDATVRRMDLAPDSISIPSFIAPFRAVIGLCDFTLHFSGRTGTFKSEDAALINQHFGPGINSRNLPGSWHGTENALEGLAFTAKDAIFVIDDFAPAGSPHDIQRFHQKADRIIRHQGNNNSRQRMRPDGSLRPPKPPRGLIVSTGEDVPRGHSLRARMLIIEVKDGDIDVAKLTACQSDAAAGLDAAAMAGFIQWLAPRYEQVQTTLRAQINELRQQAAKSGQHRRTPDIVASLAVGMKYFLAFARDAGVIDANQADGLWQRCWAALGQVAVKQDAYQKASEPTRRFIELLLSAIASGHAHLASARGSVPSESPEGWGWRIKAVGSSDEWQSQGERVGWIDGTTIYLEPDASYGAAQKMAPGGADGLGITAQTLRKRLAERGLLVVDESREVNTVRRTLEGQQRNVLQLTDGALAPEKPDNPDIPAGPAIDNWQNCQVCQVSPGVDPQERQVELDERAGMIEF